MPCVSDNGATAPISALTNAFSIGLDRGHQTDDFGARIIEVAVPGALACAAKATLRRRDVTRTHRAGTDQPTAPDAKTCGEPPRSR